MAFYTQAVNKITSTVSRAGKYAESMQSRVASATARMNMGPHGRYETMARDFYDKAASSAVAGRVMGSGPYGKYETMARDGARAMNSRKFAAGAVAGGAAMGVYGHHRRSSRY